METNEDDYEEWRRARFKSYYVVWKPRMGSNSDRFCVCLNRTMQYGNLDEVFKMCFPCHLFKSYYVVWKLR